MKYAALGDRRLVILGFGSIGPAVLPLILRHIELAPDALVVVAADDHNRAIAERYGARFVHAALTRFNYPEILGGLLRPGDFLLNLSIHVASIDLILLCHRLGALYLDTSTETWDTPEEIAQSTYERRRRCVSYRQKLSDGPTALICHGANPGLISHFAKQALMDLAEAAGRPLMTDLGDPLAWARLARDLGIVRVHISERDTQVGSSPRRVDEYVNTWSVDGLMEEAAENAGFVFGTHEDELPAHVVKRQWEADGCKMIELRRPGGTIMTRSWVPSCGEFDGYLITHPEVFSLAELLSIPRSNGRAAYRPTVHFVYRPCQPAVASLRDAAERNWGAPGTKRLLFLDVAKGMDELGILLMRDGCHEAYWFGSELDIGAARALAPHTNATSLQVAAGVLSGMVWVLENPRAGLVEPEQMNFRDVLRVARPYLGRLQGYRALWKPPRKLNGEASRPSWKCRDIAMELV